MRLDFALDSAIDHYHTSGDLAPFFEALDDIGHDGPFAQEPQAAAKWADQAQDGQRFVHGMMFGSEEDSAECPAGRTESGPSYTLATSENGHPEPSRGYRAHYDAPNRSAFSASHPHAPNYAAVHASWPHQAGTSSGVHGAAPQAAWAATTAPMVPSQPSQINPAKRTASHAALEAPQAPPAKLVRVDHGPPVPRPAVPYEAYQERSSAPEYQSVPGAASTVRPSAGSSAASDPEPVAQQPHGLTSFEDARRDAATAPSIANIFRIFQTYVDNLLVARSVDGVKRQVPQLRTVRNAKSNAAFLTSGSRLSANSIFEELIPALEWGTMPELVAHGLHADYPPWMLESAHVLFLTGKLSDADLCGAECAEHHTTCLATVLSLRNHRFAGGLAPEELAAQPRDAMTRLLKADEDAVMRILAMTRHGSRHFAKARRSGSYEACAALAAAAERSGRPALPGVRMPAFCRGLLQECFHQEGRGSKAKKGEARSIFKVHGSEPREVASMRRKRAIYAYLATLALPGSLMAIVAPGYERVQVAATSPAGVALVATDAAGVAVTTEAPLLAQGATALAPAPAPAPASAPLLEAPAPLVEAPAPLVEAPATLESLTHF
ncbi:unnamed protein product [Pedinophyceae sp. YPF-701]|nr:unnamed protein product [Pedinophyceae sp. YPF-701]